MLLISSAIFSLCLCCCVWNARTDTVWLQNDDAKYVKLLHGKWMHWPFLPLLILSEEVVSLTPLVDTAFRINILLFLPSLGSDTHICLVWCMHRLCGSIRICGGLDLALTLELDT